MLVLLAGMSNIDPAVYEAARLDGAGWFRRIWNITLPMISRVMQFLSIINVIYTFTSLFGFIYVMTSGGPAVMTLAVLSFLSIWNELLLGMMLLPDESKRLLTVAVASLVGRYVTNQPLLMAGLFIGSVPSIIIFIIFSRHLIKGISVGVGR